MSSAVSSSSTRVSHDSRSDQRDNSLADPSAAPTPHSAHQKDAILPHKSNDRAAEGRPDEQLQQTIEKGPSSEQDPAAIGPPPDGGWQAWLQVAASFFLFFNPWGMVNAFGAFQYYYDEHLGQSPSNISWIGTFQGFLLLFIGGISGPLYDKGHMRLLVALGLFLMTFGMMMTSISTEYYQVFLAQGIVVGLGCGACFVPSVSVVAQWFTKKRPIALGIIAVGGSISALIYPIIFRRLQPQLGFGWATRIIGFITLATLTFSLVFLRQRLPPPKHARALLDVRAFRTPAFWYLGLGMFLIFLGLYMPIFYMSPWAVRNIGASQDFAFYLLSIINAGSAVGRLSGGFIAVYFGPVNSMLFMTTCAAILLFAWISVDTIATAIVFCIFYGVFSGAVVSLQPSFAATIVPSIEVTGTWFGMLFTIASFGLLIGNPIAGAIIDSQDGDYLGAQCYAGAAVIAGSIVLSFVRYEKYKAGRGLTTPT